MNAQFIEVLLIDDDEDDYIITSELLEESQHRSFHLQWVDNYQDAMAVIQKGVHDVYLIDYRLGQYNGLDILREAIANRCKQPLVLLTGQGDHEIETQAMELGASDYLVKGQFSSELLERSIAYAIRHKSTLNRLEKSEKQYRAVIESQSELICRFTPDTILTFVNGAYCRYFRKTAAELIGRSWLELVPEDQHEPIRTYIASLVQSHNSVTYEHKAITASGKIRWQQWTDQIVSTEDGFAELQSVGIDITERKEAELALEEALRRERELNELKSRFVSIASHEFRTPLAKIMGMASFLEMAEHKIETEKRIIRLQKIQSACREMTELMDDVLVYGKGEADRLEYYPETVDLASYIPSLIKDVKMGVGQDHHIVFNMETQQLFIDADQRLLRQIVTNLLTNAVKYSPKHSTVTVKVRQKETAVSLCVQDQGVGIPEADQPHLFEPFHRAKNVLNTSGTGLGLAITAKAVEMHQGEITFQSTEGAGTLFIVTFPRQSIGVVS